MSARPHVIYFPLVCVDVAEMIADDFFEKPCAHLHQHVQHDLSCARHVFFFFAEQLGESWMSDISAFLPHLGDL